jgi:hypothetical protein
LCSNIKKNKKEQKRTKMLPRWRHFGKRFFRKRAKKPFVSRKREKGGRKTVGLTFGWPLFSSDLIPLFERPRTKKDNQKESKAPSQLSERTFFLAQALHPERGGGWQRKARASPPTSISI